MWNLNPVVMTSREKLFLRHRGRYVGGNPEPTNQTDCDEPLNIDMVISASERRKLLASCPSASILVAGARADCVLDTGAVTSLVSAEFYREHLAKKLGNLDEVGGFVRLVGVNGESVPVDGYLETSVELFGQKFVASFLVLSDMAKGNIREPSAARLQYFASIVVQAEQIEKHGVIK